MSQVKRIPSYVYVATGTFITLGLILIVFSPVVAEHFGNFSGYMGCSIGAGFIVSGAVGLLTYNWFSNIIFDFLGILKNIYDGHESVDIPYKSQSDWRGVFARMIEMIQSDRGHAQDEIESLKSQSYQAPTPVAPLMNLDMAPVCSHNLSAIESQAYSLIEGSKEFKSLSSQVTFGIKNIESAVRSESGDLSTTSVLVDQIESGIDEVHHKMVKSNKVYQEAATTADEANQRVNSLADAAGKITEVVQVIQDIANQTHLLALNAKIEAARAGEAGKGFVVVASEVKNLANLTTKATDEIIAQIGTIQSATEDSVSTIRGILNSVEQIRQVSSEVDDAITSQHQAVQEISRNVKTICDSNRTIGSGLDTLSSQHNDLSGITEKIRNTSERIYKEATNQSLISRNIDVGSVAVDEKSSLH